MKIASELFSWFKHESICPDVRALNATFLVHSTPNSIIGKGYCVWRSQMSFFTWFKHEFIFPDVRTLNATIFVHSTPNIIIGRGYCVGRSQKSFLAHLSMTSLSWSSSVECYHFRTFNAKQYYWQGILFMKMTNELFSWFKHESICSNVRALNATIFVHSTPNSIIGKKYYVWRLQVSYLVDLSTSPYVLMLERWMLPFSYIRRPTVLLVRNIVYEDRKSVI